MRRNCSACSLQKRLPGNAGREHRSPERQRIDRQGYKTRPGRARGPQNTEEISTSRTGRDYPSRVTRVPDSGREATHAEVLDQLGVAVAVTDAVGHVTSWNTRAAELYGWPVEEAVGRRLEELVAGPGKDAAADEIVTPLRTGRRWQGMLRVRCRDGSLVTTFMRNSPLLDAAGNVIGVVTVSLEPGDPELAQAVQAASAGDGR